MKTQVERDQVERYVRDVVAGKFTTKPCHMDCSEFEVKEYLETGLNKPMDLDHLGEQSWNNLTSSVESISEGFKGDSNPFVCAGVVGTGWLLLVCAVKGVTVATATAFIATNAVQILGLGAILGGASGVTKLAVDKHWDWKKKRRQKKVKRGDFY